MANQTQQLARLLGDAGVRVDIVQVNAPYRPAWIAGLRGVRALFRLVPFVLQLWHCAGRVDLIHVMANSGWAWHLFAAPAVWIARLRGRPVVVNYRGGGAEGFLAAQARWVRPTIAAASALVVPSGFLKAVFAKHGIAAEVVPNIVDPGRFHPGGATHAGPHLVVTRNLEALYDIPTAIHAFRRVRDHHPTARLTVAGSGPCREALERLCVELGVGESVAFPGRLDNERVAELYRAADLLLNPSRVDNMPISLLEALASGVPIVSTDVGGVPYLVEDGKTALLVPPGDPDAMGNAALRVLGDAALAGPQHLETADAEAPVEARDGRAM
jgi:glycosyltransferase involved in cell wall biosynthesis